MIELLISFFLASLIASMATTKLQHSIDLMTAMAIFITVVTANDGGVINVTDDAGVTIVTDDGGVTVQL